MKCVCGLSRASKTVGVNPCWVKWGKGFLSSFGEYLGYSAKFEEYLDFLCIVGVFWLGLLFTTAHLKCVTTFQLSFMTMLVD